MTQFNRIQAIYLIGAGGIGVSALGRYFKAQGKLVAGYDRTLSPVTERLQKEGIHIHFDDCIDLVPTELMNIKRENLLVIYTPAVPNNMSELSYFRRKGYTVLKRAEVLGIISKAHKTLAVAGTHGKTSVSTIIAHIFKTARADASSVLGGISKNYDSNLILNESDNTEFLITEADEFDRSFLHLYPHTLVLTSMDADHLDIYRSIHDLHETMAKLASQVSPEGHIVAKKALPLNTKNCKAKRFTYSLKDKADFYAGNIDSNTQISTFDLHTPDGVISDISIQIPGQINIENVVAAAAVAHLNGISNKNIREGLRTWLGVKRRFEYIINTPEIVYIDDYAHHPEELNAFIGSVRELYDGRILGIFQPHLFSRTQDFANDFAMSLSALDELIIMDIYPAREEPIPGVTSEVILKNVNLPDKSLVRKADLLNTLEQKEFDVLLTMGAGDIDRFVEPIKELLSKRIAKTSNN